jgi:hypothetical protein
MAGRRIGEILVAQGVLTEAAVNRALGYQRVSGDRLKLGTILLNWDMLAEDGLLEALSRHYGVPAAPWPLLNAAPIDLTRLLPPAVAVRVGAFPYALTRAGLHVAFLDPANLAAQDEVSVVTGKRIVPAVALEIRMLQAHQKFYGRHIPLEYRSIVQKMDRRSARTKVPDLQRTSDFRVRDLVEAESRPQPPPPPAIRSPLEPTGARPIRVERGLPDSFAADGTPRIEVPDMPMPGSRASSDRLSDTDPAALGKRKKERAAEDRMSDTRPVSPRPGEADPIPSDADPGEAPQGDDTLPKRMGPRFPSLSTGSETVEGAPDIVEPLDLRPEPTPRQPRRRETDRRPSRSVPEPPGGSGPRDMDETLPRGAAAHLAPHDLVADMWRPAPEPAVEADPDGRMWTPSVAEIEASIGEARTREEIGQVALGAFLADFPRVLLLGCGKEAITSWQGRGENLPGEAISAIRIPLSEPTVFSDVRATGVPHFGPLEPPQWPASLRAVLGDSPPDCAVFPIRILDGIAAFLYADRLGEPLHYQDFAVIARASAATANALARFLLRRSNPAPVA